MAEANAEAKAEAKAEAQPSPFCVTMETRVPVQVPTLLGLLRWLAPSSSSWWSQFSREDASTETEVVASASASASAKMVEVAAEELRRATELPLEVSSSQLAPRPLPKLTWPPPLPPPPAFFASPIPRGPGTFRGSEAAGSVAAKRAAPASEWSSSSSP